MFTDTVFAALLAGWFEFRLGHAPQAPEPEERLRADAGLPPPAPRLPPIPFPCR